MTTVNIKLSIPTETGSIPAVGAIIEFHPSYRIEIDNNVILPQPFNVELDINGEAVVELEPTTAYFCWRIREMMHGGENFYVAVDNVVSVNYTDLVRVDPATITPYENIAAWEAAVAQLDGIYTGPQGPQGIPGTNGTNGVGVPTGGTAGQILAKVDGTNYNTEWINNYTEETRIYVKNANGSVITKGSVVYITGASGANILIGLADADTELTSSKTLGIAVADIAVNGFGWIITEGMLHGINTSGAATEGQPIWLSSTAGQFIYGTPPAKPAHMVYLGVVTRKNNTNGAIFIRVANGFELNELHDVNITNPQEGQTLKLRSGVWVNEF